jgi:hypothetical protein
MSATALVCLWCEASYEPPTVPHDSPDEARDRRRRLSRQPLCRACHERWDHERCPDGQEHDERPLGHFSAASGPLEGGPFGAWECARCGVGRIGAPLENLLAHLAARGHNVRRRS